MTNLILFLGLAMLVGCAKPVLDLAEPEAEERATARMTLETTRLAPRPPPEGPLDMKARLDSVLPDIRHATYQVCTRLNLKEARCTEAAFAPVTFFALSRELNAYANLQDEVGVFGGLAKISTEAELAAVVAHEFSHVMLGHVQKKTKNALAGMMIAGGAAAAYAGYTRTDASAYGEDWMRAGAALGSRAYSPEMEIEADRIAIYILHEAGYPPTAMRDAIVRMYRANPPKRRGLFRPKQVGFLQTHPSNDRRIAHILTAITDAEAGVPLKAHVRSP